MEWCRPSPAALDILEYTHIVFAYGGEEVKVEEISGCASRCVEGMIFIISPYSKDPQCPVKETTVG